VAQDALEHEPALAGELPGDLERVRPRRIDAGAVVAAVHLEPHPQVGAREGPGRLEVVHDDTHSRPGLVHDAPHAREVRGVEGEGPRQVGQPRTREFLGLDQRGDREPLRAVLELQTPELDALVRLRVRAQPYAQTLCPLGHLGDVALHHVQVQQQRRRFEVVERH
jgi:hypothetical protein